jgi:hypothetical protein
MRLTEEDRRLLARKKLEQAMSAASNPSSLPPEMSVMAAAKGFLEHLRDKPMLTQIGPQGQHAILEMAHLAALLRTKVDREQYGDREITFEPVIEASPRLVGQFTKLCMCAPVILGENTVSQKVLKQDYPRHH